MARIVSAAASSVAVGDTVVTGVATHHTYKFPTRDFVEFCEKHGIKAIADVKGYVIESWKNERKKEDITQVTLHRPMIIQNR